MTAELFPVIFRVCGGDGGKQTFKPVGGGGGMGFGGSRRETIEEEP